MTSSTLSPPAPAAAPPAAERTHREILALLVPLMLVLFIATLDQTIVATALSTIGDDLHDAGNASWIATAYLITSAVTTLIFGKLGDLYGRKGVFQASVAIFLVGSLLSGLSGSMTALIAFRALQGIGGGGLSSLVQAIVGDLVPARQRARYQAWFGIVATLAIVAGPLLGGVFSDAISWRWIFFVNLPIGLVALVAIATRLRLPARRSDRAVDFGGGVLATVVTTAVLLVTVWGGQRFAWTSAPVLGLLAASALGLLAYILVERRAAEPITPPRLFANHTFVICSALFFLSTLVLFAAMLYVPAFMVRVHGDSAFTSGLFVIPLLVGLIAATAVSGARIPKTGRYRIYPILGSLLAGGGMLALSRITAGTPAVVLVAILAVAGAGLGFFIQVSVLAGQNAVAHRDLGVATGALNFFKTLGGAFGAALFGAILAAHAMTTRADAVAAFQSVFLWTVPFMAIALVLALALREAPLSDAMLAVAEGKVEVPEY